MNKRAFAKKLREISRNVHDINHVYKSGEEFWYLLTADRHWDNPDSDWDLQIKHLKEARERDAMVIDVGDFFCEAIKARSALNIKKQIILIRWWKPGQIFLSLTKTCLP
jgi:hypothetical protein